MDKPPATYNISASPSPRTFDGKISDDAKSLLIRNKK